MITTSLITFLVFLVVLGAGRRVPVGYQRLYGDIGVGTVRVLLLYNHGYDSNGYTAEAGVVVVVVVVVVVGNFDSWGSFCYFLACSSVACLGDGRDSVCFCFIKFQ